MSTTSGSNTACEPLPWLPRPPAEPWPPVVPMADIPLAEIRRAYELLADKYPPMLSLTQAAELSGLKPGTLKRKVSEGAFADSVSKGKPLRFWRDRFVRYLMK